MALLTESAWEIFNTAIADYHKTDRVDAVEQNPYPNRSLEWLLYAKNWIDTVQWHYEDLIRDEDIIPEEALVLKRKIDASNQKRTDLVEYIDTWFLQKYKDVAPLPNARINTETPAWAIDRLSILALKIWHMAEEANRLSADEGHRALCSRKLDVLQLQHKDLSQAIEQLIDDIERGAVLMKAYKQMKMYNDESLNPILYQKTTKK